MRVDLDRQLQFPHDIAPTSLQPDIVLWSASARTVIMAELTLPWDEGIEAAYKRKKEKYNEVAAACTKAGWKASTYPVVVACILHWKVLITIPRGSWNYQAQAEEGPKGNG